MILEKVTRQEGKLEDLLKQAEDGDRVVLWKGLFQDSTMEYDSTSFFHSYMGKIYLNGEVVAEGITEKWGLLHGKPIVYGENFIRDACDKGNIIYEGEWDSFGELDGKLLIKRDKQLLVDGVTPVFEGPYAGFRYHEHPLGFLIEWPNGSRGISLRLNGHKEIFRSNKHVEWESYGSGIMTKQGADFYLNDVVPLCRGLAVDDTAWYANREGIIAHYEDEVFLKVIRPEKAN